MDRFAVMSLYTRVVETGSFSRAAEELAMGQPTASKQIAALERRLGVRLLERSTRRLHATEAGREYYERCRRVLEEVDALESGVSAGAHHGGRPHPRRLPDGLRAALCGADRDRFHGRAPGSRGGPGDERSLRGPGRGGGGPLDPDREPERRLAAARAPARQRPDLDPHQPVRSLADDRDLARRLEALAGATRVVE